MAEPMKIRANLQGDVAEVRVLISHPMETGQRKDRKTGELIPIHHITRVIATLNGQTVLDADWSQAVSKNPFIGFKVKGAKAGDKIAVTWEDNRGAKNSVETTVTGG
jgi:sulfur-oxidizing protein SoxZ